MDAIVGMFDVGGLGLYMRCVGSGSPTIVYLHGSIEDGGFSGASSAVPIQSMLSDRYRFCVYDRRNVGRSEEVPGYWTGATAVADLHALLAAAGVEPPYVLLGASLGGLISHIYAATYPEEVVGMVLLDSPVPNELELESLLPEDMRFNHEEDKGTNENLDHFATYEEAYALQAPDIPVTYLLATPSEWPTMGVPAWDAAILDTIKQYVDGFSPGKWVEVESPHYMEAAVPEVIAEELEKLIETVSTTPSALAVEAPPLEFKGHEGDLWGVEISPDGKYLATGSSDKTARLWDLATGETIRIFSDATDEVGTVAFSPDGRYLAAGSIDTKAYIWDVASGEMVQVLSGHTSGVEVSGFSPDGKYIATAGGAENTARIWDVAGGQTVHVLSGHTAFVPRVAFSPDGKYVLTGSEDQTARLWDSANGKEVRALKHPQTVGSVAFSPDGKYVATGCDDSIARLWDVATGQLLREFSGHQGFINGVAFSPDGRFLLTGSRDTTARLWDLATGQTVRVFKGHRGDAQGVTFSPDGSLVATASNDGVARVWNLQTAPVIIPAGGEPGTVTLRLAVADGGGVPSEPYVLEFVEQVRTRSEGKITIEPMWEAGNMTPAGFETGTIQLVKDGEAELGLAGSRAFDTVDVLSFQALQAPFLIDNDALAKAVAASDAARQMLDDLSAAGMVGLTLWPEDLRHPFSWMPEKPILAPEDFAGLNVRVTPSGVSNRLIEAMGGSPVTAESDYQAAEGGLRQAASFPGSPTATGNVTFFSKFQVLFANEAAFEGLSDAQRAILRDAAAATQEKAIAEHPGEVDAGIAWCADGATVVMASDEQVAAFEAAAKPVFDWVEQNSFSAEMIAALRELKESTEPSAGAEACAPGMAQ